MFNIGHFSISHFVWRAFIKESSHQLTLIFLISIFKNISATANSHFKNPLGKKKPHKSLKKVDY
jgi:hypothetical protein